MSVTVTPSPYIAPEFDSSGEREFRSISKAAIASLVLGFLSLLAFIFATALIFPVIAIGFGLIAWNSIRQFPEELSGATAAKIGLLLGSVCFFGAIGQHSYIHATEVPEGYERISFRMLRDDAKTVLPYAEAAEELDGKKVFIKGYVRPGSKRKNLTEFIMVGNFGDCCFGGQEKITEVVAVRINTGDTVDYSLRLRKIAGVFHLNRKSANTSDNEVPQVFYQIEADYVR